jgi:hypothetical protein
MAAKEWASLLGGLALASLGLTALAASGPGEAPAVPAAPPVTAAPVVITVAPPDADLPAAVEAVLAGNGPLEVIDPGTYGIPAAVARVLAERGVVLTVSADGVAPPIPARGQ